MKTPTLAGEFDALRKSRKLTLLQIANLCDLNETTVHKVSSGRTVRWETLHLILAIGMGVQPGTTVYESIHRLWMRQREEIASANTKTKGSKTSPKYELAAVRKFRKLIKGRDERETRLIFAAASKRASSLGV